MRVVEVLWEDAVATRYEENACTVERTSVGYISYVAEGRTLVLAQTCDRHGREELLCIPAKNVLSTRELV